MQLLYQSEQFVVVALQVPQADAVNATDAAADAARGGYEIVDKRARHGIFIQGELAEQFRAGVESLAQREPDVDVLDEYIGRFTALSGQAMRLH